MTDWNQFFLTLEGNTKHNSNKNDLQKYKACFPLLFSTLAYQVIFLFSTESVSHQKNIQSHVVSLQKGYDLISLRPIKKWVEQS